MASLNEMDGRAAALILSSILDTVLETAIKFHFVQLSKRRFNSVFRNPTAPLSTFSSKIAIGYALGIYGDELRSQMDRIRSIRNAFAHAMLSISFDDPVIAAACNKLDPRRLMTEGETYQAEKNTPRERFTVTANLATILLLRHVQTKADEDRYGYNPWRVEPLYKYLVRHLQTSSPD
jgi:hypothetical protein